ncbi:MAG: tetratricopeptide repeat protein [Cyanobacteria bacterium]|nr:tetratricopeptide repeat protein [Cyanobacteriota bacterium]
MSLRRQILLVFSVLWFTLGGWGMVSATAIAAPSGHAHHSPADPTVPAVFAFNEEAERWFNQGLDRVYLKDYEGAIDAFSKSLSAASDYRVYLERGKVYAHLGRWTQAITDYTQALSLSAVDDFYVHFLRGQAWEAVGDFKSAIADYTESIRIYPSDGLGYTRRGAVYAKTGQLLLAHRDFKAAIEQNAGRSEAYVERGNLRLMLGNAAGALADYRIAIKLFTASGHTEDAQAVQQKIEQLQLGA